MSNPWFIITGGPSVGKSSVVEELGKRGHYTSLEVARSYIDGAKAVGITIDQLRRDENRFQENIFGIMLALEGQLPIDRFVFLERGFLDVAGHQRYLGVEVGEQLDMVCRNNRYRKAYLLDRLPYIEDEARTETPEQAQKIHDSLEETYRHYGVEVVNVPVDLVTLRASFIIKNAQETIKTPML